LFIKLEFTHDVCNITSDFEIVSAVEDLKDPSPIKASSFVSFLRYFSEASSISLTF